MVRERFYPCRALFQEKPSCMFCAKAFSNKRPLGRFSGSLDPELPFSPHSAGTWMVPQVHDSASADFGKGPNSGLPSDRGEYQVVIVLKPLGPAGVYWARAWKNRKSSHAGPGRLSYFQGHGTPHRLTPSFAKRRGVERSTTDPHFPLTLIFWRGLILAAGVCGTASTCRVLWAWPRNSPGGAPRFGPPAPQPQGPTPACGSGRLPAWEEAHCEDGRPAGRHAPR